MRRSSNNGGTHIGSFLYRNHGNFIKVLNAWRPSTLTICRELPGSSPLLGGAAFLKSASVMQFVIVFAKRLRCFPDKVQAMLNNLPLRFKFFNKNDDTQVVIPGQYPKMRSIVVLQLTSVIKVQHNKKLVTGIYIL